jgi:uncharacterized protein YbcI
MTDTDTDIGTIQRESVSMAISNLTVRIVKEHTGRGPTSARTHLGDDLITVLLRDSLTAAETTLVEHGKSPSVLNMRRLFQGTMREDLITGVEAITGRTVAAFMSTNHIDPDIGVEIFVLDPSPPTPVVAAD